MGGLFRELRRRNVFRVAGVYAVVAWLVMQVVAVMTPALELPGWVDGFFAVLLIAGFPIAVIFAWAFELTPEGVKLTRNVPENESIAPRTARKLDYAIVIGLALVAILIVADRLTRDVPQIVAATNAIKVDDASIAVLPFADLSPDGDQEYFSDGIAEEILNVLAGVQGLKVASRTSAFAFKGQSTLGIPVIANELNVRHVLEGSVRRSGQTIRITAQLIDAETDQHLWSETFDRTLTAENLFAIQDDIANAIVARLAEKMPMAAIETPSVTVSADTQNLDAYELYLKANALFIARGNKNVKESFRLFTEATKLDPEFARGWAGLAAVASIAESWGLYDLDYLPIAKEAAERAIALNPDLSLPYAALGEVRFYQEPRDYGRAIELFNKALDVDPANATAVFWRGEVYYMLGFFEQANVDFNRCLELDPAYANCRRFLAASNIYQADYAAAHDNLQQVLLTGFSEPAMGVFYKLYDGKDQRDELILFLTSGIRFAAGEDANWLVERLYRAIVDPSYDHERELEVIISRLKAVGYSQETNPSLFNNIFLIFGAYDRMAPNVWPYQWHPLLDGPENEIYRKRFIDSFQMLGYWREHGFPPQCRPIGADDYTCD